MTAFDLEQTYLFVDGAGGLTAQAVGPTFWAEIADNPLAGATMISAGAGAGDWPQWEMHPAGAEVLVILEGAPRIWLEHPDGRLETVAARPGATVVVPRGAWHRVECEQPHKILYVTYGSGTTHRPVTDEDRAGALAAMRRA
jgi:mannose-6-phosphate isomerase-like protein (cupin superfamily)